MAKEKLTLSQAELDEIICKAVTAGIESYKAEQAKDHKQTRDKRYENTKLLLKNYRSFKAFAKTAVYDLTSAARMSGTPELLEALGLMGEARKVESIRDRVAMARVAMTNIDIALDVYHNFCEAQNRPEIARRYQAIYLTYLSDEVLTTEEILAKMGIGKSQYYEDINSACEELEKRFFGITYDLFS